MTSLASLFKTSALLKNVDSLFGDNHHTRIGQLIIDATHSEDIELSARVTEIPVSSGKYISDHISLAPLEIKIEGSITDSAIRFMGIFETSLQDNSLEKITNNIKSLSPLHQTVSPSKQAQQLLTSMMREKKIVDVVTKREAYRNMVITNLSFAQDADTGEQLMFSVELKQISFGKVLSIIEVNPQDKMLKRMTAPKVNRGTIQTIKEPPKQEPIINPEEQKKEVSTTLFKKVWNWTKSKFD